MSALSGLHRRRDDTGAAAVEFGLIAVVMLTLVIGIIQFSLYFWAYQVGGHAAREGARRYAVDPCNVSAQNDVITRSRVGSAATGTVGVTHTFGKGPLNVGGARETGDQVTVTVTYSAPDVGGGLIPGLPLINKSATARVEDVQDCP